MWISDQTLLFYNHEYASMSYAYGTGWRFGIFRMFLKIYSIQNIQNQSLFVVRNCGLKAVSFDIDYLTCNGANMQ